MYTLLLTSVRLYRIHSHDHFSSYGGDAVQRVEYKCLYSMFTSHLLCICLACGRSPLTMETIISISIAITHPITLKWLRMCTYITERWTFLFYGKEIKLLSMGGAGGLNHSCVIFPVTVLKSKVFTEKKGCKFFIVQSFHMC